MDKDMKLTIEMYLSDLAEFYWFKGATAKYHEIHDFKKKVATTETNN